MIPLFATSVRLRFELPPVTIPGVVHVESNGYLDEKSTKDRIATMAKGSPVLWNMPGDGAIADKRLKAAKLVRSALAPVVQVGKWYREAGIDFIPYSMVGRGNGAPASDWALAAEYAQDILNGVSAAIAVGCYLSDGQWSGGAGNEKPDWISSANIFAALAMAAALANGRPVVAVTQAYTNAEPIENQHAVPTNVNYMFATGYRDHGYHVLQWGRHDDDHTRETAGVFQREALA